MLLQVCHRLDAVVKFKGIRPNIFQTVGITCGDCRDAGFAGKQPRLALFLRLKVYALHFQGVKGHAHDTLIKADAGPGGVRGDAGGAHFKGFMQYLFRVLIGFKGLNCCCVKTIDKNIPF